MPKLRRNSESKARKEGMAAERAPTEEQKLVRYEHSLRVDNRSCFHVWSYFEDIRGFGRSCRCCGVVDYSFEVGSGRE